MSDLDTVGLPQLRKGICQNHVSFPSQIPVFVRNAAPDLQRHSVQLYFLRGWSAQKIANRYGYSRFYIWQIVNDWKRHAVSLGYIQVIPPQPAAAVLRKAIASYPAVA